jgi:maltokinase
MAMSSYPSDAPAGLPVGLVGVAPLLAAWLPGQRWFAGKGTDISSVEVVSASVLPTGAVDAELAHLLVAVSGSGTTDRYQMFLGVRPVLPERLEHALVGALDGAAVYDAVHDGELMPSLLQAMAAGSTSGDLRFASVPGAELDLEAPSRVMSAEQSNTSVVFGDSAICKLFRRIAPGPNPDLELTLALADAGSTHVARPLGWIEMTLDGEETTLAMTQEFLPSGTEGWAMATASVRDLFAEADLHADEVGGDFAAESERLGIATAEVHADLARTLPSGIADPGEAAATAQQMRDRLDAAIEVVADLAPFADGLRAAYDAVAEIDAPVAVQRVHGDYHLGQVLRTDTGWVVLDFEGEPARPLAERTAQMSPLRDVAGMLRSFDYAAQHLLEDMHGDSQLAYRAAEWAQRNRSAFCDGYASGGGRDPREESVLLRAFELDKAVYEVVYEARHRPSWLSVPLGSVERLVG